MEAEFSRAVEKNLYAHAMQAKKSLGLDDATRHRRNVQCFLLLLHGLEGFSHRLKPTLRR